MTAEQNDKRAAYAIRMFGDVPLQNLTSMRIEQALGALMAKGGRKTATHPEGKPLSSKTVRPVAALVSQALDKAVRWRKIERNPMAEVVRPAARRKEVEIMEPHEYEQYLNRVQGTRYYALSVFAAASGCRRGELLALRWADIDPHSGVVTISKSISETKAGREIKVTKSGKTRFVRVSQTTLHVLLEHRAQLDEEKRLFGSDYKNNDLVFPTPDGDYYKTDQVTGRISEFNAAGWRPCFAPLTASLLSIDDVEPACPDHSCQQTPRPCKQPDHSRCLRPRDEERRGYRRNTLGRCDRRHHRAHTKKAIRSEFCES